MANVIEEFKQAPAHVAEANNSLLSKAQVAARLNVSVRTVENWMSLKIVPYVKPAGLVRFIWSDVEQALRRNFGVGYPLGTTSTGRR
jgi:excisionase family DNA binding protein